MKFDTQLIGGSSEGHTTGGRWARQGGAAEENISAQCLLNYRVIDGRKPLATIDALIWQGAVEWSMAVERLPWWWFLPVLEKLEVEGL